MKILGIETSCDETAAAVYDSENKRILSSSIFSQVKLHEVYGGVVPEIASRSHLEKIDLIVWHALQEASCTLEQIDAVAVTYKPGLIGSLLIGICFAKSIAWAANKKLIGVNHLEGHIFSSFIGEGGEILDLPFPFLCLSVSGGHTSLYLVKDFGEYEQLGQTLDDAAGEAFDKIAQLLGLGYPGGPVIEKLALEVGNKDFFHYPRTKNEKKNFEFSFSGVKTAVLYDLVKKGAFEFGIGPLEEKLTAELVQQVAASLQHCIADILYERIALAFERYPEIKAFSFVGGVAANKFIRGKLLKLCEENKKQFSVPPLKYCVDNGAMIAFVGAKKVEKGEDSPLTLDAMTS